MGNVKSAPEGKGGADGGTEGGEDGRGGNSEASLPITTETEFTVAEELGAGSFGVVHRGFFNDKEVAIKTLNWKAVQDAFGPDGGKAREFFDREIQALAIINGHEHIVTVYGHCNHPDGRVSLILEYAPEGTLEKYIDKSELRPAVEIASIIHNIASALQHIHSKGFCHNDIKTENILVYFFGFSMVVKLADFGLVKRTKSVLAGPFKATYQGQFDGMLCLGTCQWAAPENFDKHPRDAYFGKSPGDIYSLAMVLYHILSRKLPWAGLPYNAVFTAVVRGDRPTVPAPADAGFVQLMKSCWAHDPAARPTSSGVLTIVAEFIKKPPTEESFPGRIKIDRSVLVIGPTGVGKSTIVNMLYNASSEPEKIIGPAKTSMTAAACTTKSVMYYSFARNLALFDTIGVGDPRLETADIVRSLRCLVRDAAEGLSTVIFVMKCGRVDHEDRINLATLLQLFAPGDLKEHGILVLTHYEGDMGEEAERAYLEEWLSGESRSATESAAAVGLNGEIPEESVNLTMLLGSFKKVIWTSNALKGRCACPEMRERCHVELSQFVASCESRMYLENTLMDQLIDFVVRIRKRFFRGLRGVKGVVKILASALHEQNIPAYCGECCICMKELEFDQASWFSCGHQTHKECAKQHVSKACPVCGKLFSTVFTF